MKQTLIAEIIGRLYLYEQSKRNRGPATLVPGPSIVYVDSSHKHKRPLELLRGLQSYAACADRLESTKRGGKDSTC